MAETLFSSQVPDQPNVADGSHYEMGMKFQVSATGYILAIRFYKGLNDEVVHTGHIWNSTGTELASVVFSGETTSGWQQASLASPLLISANTTYVVSVNSGDDTHQAFYPFTSGGLLASISNNLHISSVADGHNGVFKENQIGVFPDGDFGSSNYFRDIVFAPSDSGTNSDRPRSRGLIGGLL